VLHSQEYLWMTNYLEDV